MSKQFLYIFISLLGLSACNIDEFDQIDTETETFHPEVDYVNNLISRAIQSSTDKGIELACLTIQLPFSVIDENQVVHQILTNEDFTLLVNDSSLAIIDFVYPLTVKDEIGILFQANDLWELASSTAGCFPSETDSSGLYFQAFDINFDHSCYELQFPLFLMDIGGNSLIVENRNSFVELLTTQTYFFHFPNVGLKNAEGQVIYPESSEQLMSMLMDCNNVIWEYDSTFVLHNYFYLGCYEYVFPINVLVTGVDETVQVQNAATLENIFIQGKFGGFVFPIKLRDSEGEIVEVQSEQALNSLLNNCFYQGDLLLLLMGTSIFNSIPCYQIEFPVKAYDGQGTQKIFSNIHQLITALETSDLIEYTLDYPVFVLDYPSNSRIRLESIEDILTLLDHCQFK